MTVQVKGLAELNKYLQQLPAKVEANVLRGALAAGARVVAAQARVNVPVDTGALRSSIRVGSSIDRRVGKVVAYVRAGSRGKTKSKGAVSAYYVHMIEYGVRAHEISVKTGKRGLFFGGVVRKKVMHPGFGARPFLRPAMDTRARDAVVAAGNHMKRRLATKHGIDTADIAVGDLL